MKIKELIQKLEKEVSKTDNLLVKAEQLSRLTEIMKMYRGEDQVISSFEVAEKLKEKKEEYKILSGWVGLDSILAGFRLKQLITVAAPTKSGKTSFCIELTSRVKFERPMWFPFEEGADELVQKFLDRGEQPPLFYTPEQTKGSALPWIEEKIIESIAKYGTRVVFIDHLHFVVPFTSERQDLAIGQTMRELKSLAKKWNITIFIIAHLKKTKLDTQPDLEDLRDSSFVAQESDTVIMLWRETSRKFGEVVITNNVNVSVQANRRTGKTGNVKMVFENGKFLEKDWVDKYSKERETDVQFENF